MRRDIQELRDFWRKEFEASFSGWDFSYLEGRWYFANPPWDYQKEAAELVRRSDALLDMGTGGGEFLASLAPFPGYTAATESWKPNIPVAREKLEPMGIQVIGVSEEHITPFADEQFDTVLNRHTNFDPAEISRILKPGGVFLSQQVAGDNLRDLANVFGATLLWKELTLDYWQQKIRNAGLILTTAQEWSGVGEFFDVGALVYYIKAIPWTVPGFDIERNMAELENLQRKLDSGERLVFTQRRFLFHARKPETRQPSVYITKEHNSEPGT